MSADIKPSCATSSATKNKGIIGEPIRASEVRPTVCDLFSTLASGIAMIHEQASAEHVHKYVPDQAHPCSSYGVGIEGEIE